MDVICVLSVRVVGERREGSVEERATRADMERQKKGENVWEENRERGSGRMEGHQDAVGEKDSLGREKGQASLKSTRAFLPVKAGGGWSLTFA